MVSGPTSLSLTLLVNQKLDEIAGSWGRQKCIAKQRNSPGTGISNLTQRWDPFVLKCRPQLGETGEMEIWW